MKRGRKQQLNHTTIHFWEVFRNLESWTVRSFWGCPGENPPNRAWWRIVNWRGVQTLLIWMVCVYIYILWGNIWMCHIFHIIFQFYTDGIWWGVYIYNICGILIVVLIWWEYHGNLTECTICLNHMHSNLTIHIHFCTWFRYRSHLPWHSLPSKVMVTPVFPPATEATPSGWHHDITLVQTWRAIR